MALTATVYNFDVELADSDRAVYESLALRLALHPSESIDYLWTRTLAYCLEYEPGLEFSRGISAGDEPAIWSHDAGGAIKSWIEVGTPDAPRLHKAAKAAQRVAVYTHREAAALRQLAGKQIHRAAEIPLYAFSRQALSELEALLDRRLRIQLVVSGGQLYIDVAGRQITAAVTEHRLDG
jgi:uncharacterized protein YaeQ